MPLWGQRWAVKSLAKKDHEKAVENARELLEEELRLAVARGTLENPGSWSHNNAILLSKKLINQNSKDMINKIMETRKYENSKEAVEYWYKVESLLKTLKRIPRKIP